MSTVDRHVAMAEELGKHLTEDEYMTGVRIGFMRKMASCGIGPDGVEKIAGGPGLGWLVDLIEGAGKTALLAGVPAGALWYIAEDSLSSSGSKSKKLKAKRKFYRDYVDELRRRADGSGNLEVV